MVQTEQSGSRLAYAFARFLSRGSGLQGKQKQDFESLLVRLSSQQFEGHSCIQISRDDEAILLASGWTGDAQVSPLVIEANRLYMQRYWFYEKRLAEQIKSLCGQQFNDQKLDSLIDRYFEKNTDQIDWQKEAARKAVLQAFSIITGGPGTGKTTTVVKILALLLELSGLPLHIALAAPTGKAAMRLQESIGANKETLPCDARISKLIPDKVSTIHHLLGAKPPTPFFRHDGQKPLPFDLVVVDEASMVDLALMSKLVDALKPGARLILLGDKDQLASVESGSVLADLTMALPDNTLELLKSYRFQGEIRALAEAVNQQHAELAWQLLQQNTSVTNLAAEKLITYIADQYMEYLKLIADNACFQSVFTAFNRFQVLCSNRNGPQSVAEINHQVEKLLQIRQNICLTGQWYVGRPVMVTENNAAMQLFNGDIGICVRDTEEHGRLTVGFMRSDGSIRKISPGRMPACQTVYAMTVHKSQGSEFEHVVIVLAATMNPVLTRELLYTAITRAKKTVSIVASKGVFIGTVQQRVERLSGLADKLKT